ncbi:phosphate ABC transporter permease subunit PstC [Aeromicrobium sp. CTD01-1L150]|uniref:phosphate ABC transporter permease subunit PstC n=1 Tax=Aeromicrobium sp. CTD01-1L150 TaxID=3341830 RepID=UPI0035BF2DCA
MSVNLTETPSVDDAPIDLSARDKRWGERAIVAWLFATAALSVLVTIGIVLSLMGPAVEFFREISIFQFLQAGTWAPRQGEFDVINLFVGTLNVTMWAILIAIPGGLGAAVWLSEYASSRARNVIKPVLEVLEGVPTVAYGLFAYLFVTPILHDVWPTFLPGKLGEPPGIFSAGAAGLVMGIMLIPTIASISEDAMRAVPQGLREAAYGLGSTRMQVSVKVVVPSALSGIIAAFVLGVSRGIGETMLVLIAAGATPNLTLLPNESVQTMTAFIARTATGDISQGSIDYNVIFAVGALLFVITLVMNLISTALVRRFRESYE